jgi:hypothetical protein
MLFRSRQEATQKAKEAHRVNIQKSLEHRISMAKANGDDALVRQLEAELKYFN